MKKLIAALLVMLAITPAAFAEDVTHSIVGVQGYDLVSYHVNKRPHRGTGNHVSNHEGVNYLFSSAENKKTFDKNPSKYLPAYGGYCAFGASVGKKFIADPEVWEIVDGKLYLNLDNSIKTTWVKDIQGNIEKADSQWRKIKHKSPADL